VTSWPRTKQTGSQSYHPSHHKCPAFCSFPTIPLLTHRQSRHHVSYRVREKGEDPCSADGYCIPRVSAHRGSHPSVPTHLHQSVSPLVFLHANEMTNQTRPLSGRRRWWWAHWLINFIVAGPLIFAAWGEASSASDLSQMPMDHHKVCFLNIK
jgi:hypothetical protein